MTKLPKTTDNTSSTLPSNNQQQDFQDNPIKRKTKTKPISSHSKTTTTGLSQSQQTNVLNKTPAEKSKQRQPPSNRSNENKQRQPKQQRPPIHTNLDEEYF
ncbi:unnamed protein product [Rotaria sordida]|uniref:Uncharacterized protein n=1 Tax=Rotaria sordida TaxID=392033 RepID=A0A818MJK7_9BILA|nr:unnamed protein product [Rotaria sordida]CAF1382128.1 unnamed protein product [Rotaria sordida]CAF1409462.1 unnamed protein product [Rotaria sordida]CAF3530002.1 unnamed protein product [Rotaria sordida]CAF3590246.1 unnamed protein product [Rotaria sordida]